jgi:hypothetical protein
VSIDELQKLLPDISTSHPTLGSGLQIDAGVSISFVTAGEVAVQDTRAGPCLKVTLDGPASGGVCGDGGPTGLVSGYVGPTSETQYLYFALASDVIVTSSCKIVTAADDASRVQIVGCAVSSPDSTRVNFDFTLADGKRYRAAVDLPQLGLPPETSCHC